MKKFVLASFSLLSATSAFAFPVSYCGTEAIKSAQETSDIVEDGYIHHEGCKLVTIFASPSPRESRTGTAVVQCKDDKAVVVLVSLKVTKTADGNEDCSAETQFIRGSNP